MPRYVSWSLAVERLNDAGGAGYGEKLNALDILVGSVPRPRGDNILHGSVSGTQSTRWLGYE